MIYFIYGTDEYRIAEKEQELLAQFSAGDLNNINLTKIEGSEFAISKFDQSISEVSIFGGEKVVIVYDLLTQNKDGELKGKIAEKITKEISAKVIFVEHADPDKREKLFKTLSKICPLCHAEFSSASNKKEILKQVQDDRRLPVRDDGGISYYFGSLTDYELRQWIGAKVKSLGGKIDRSAVETLALSVGPNLWRQKNEIEKLILYVKSQNRDQILSSDVEKMVESDFNPNIFQFIEAIALGKKKQAVKLMQQFIDNGENENYLLSMIVYQFRTLLIIKDLLDRGKGRREIASEARLNPYVVQKSLPILRHYSLEDLVGYYQKLYEFDTKIKTGQIEPRVAVDILVAG